MVTSKTYVTCPNCASVNEYTITALNLIDTELVVSYQCTHCNKEFTDNYAIVYLGGHSENSAYDRDNISIC